MGITSFRYLAICFGVTSLCLAMVAGLNFALDPYGYYHFDKSWDWVHQRKGIAHYLFGHKARAVETFKPEVVFLGNSRVLYGLDPAQPGLPEKTYNLAMEGANIYVAWRYLQHTAIWHLPKVVILGIDLEMFDPHSPLPTAFSEDRLSVTAEGRPNLFSNLADLAPTLLSPNALYYSLKGLISPSGPVFNYANGYEADAMLKLNHMDLTRAVLGSNEAWLVPYTAGFLDANGEEPQMDAFGKIVSFCAQNHIRLIVFLHPLHASMTDVLTDDWPRYQAWMKAMVTTLEAAPGGQNELWDFVGYTTMNTESFPKPTDEYSHMRYYWECSHYRKIVGDLVLARILSGTSSTQFGQRVDSRNLSDDLNRIAVEKANWHQHGEAILIPDP